jgi:hypothetical protein
MRMNKKPRSGQPRFFTYVGGLDSNHLFQPKIPSEVWGTTRSPRAPVVMERTIEDWNCGKPFHASAGLAEARSRGRRCGD